MAVAVAAAGSVAGRLESTAAVAGAAAVERNATAAAVVFAASRSGAIAESAAGTPRTDTDPSLDCRMQRAPRGFAAADRSLVIRFQTELLPFDLLMTMTDSWTFSDPACHVIDIRLPQPPRTIERFCACRCSETKLRVVGCIA